MDENKEQESGVQPIEDAHEEVVAVTEGVVNDQALEKDQSTEESATQTPVEDVSEFEAEQPVDVGDVAEDAVSIPIAKTKKLKKWLVWIFVVVLVATLGFAVYAYLKMTAPVRGDVSSSAPAKDNVAKLGAVAIYIQGSVEYTKNNTWQKVDSELSLHEGYKVRTGDESRAVIAFDDGSAVRLDKNSEIELSKLATNDVVVANLKGNVYSRVTASDSRTFSVTVDSLAYKALGTAYMTSNSQSLKGVEVYHSKVEAGKTTISEGQSYFVKNPDSAKQEVVAAIDIDELKKNEFIKWNKAEDAKDANFADKLGILKDIDVVSSNTAPTSTTPPAQSSPAISVRAERVSEGIRVNWSISDIDVKNGFKVAYSKTSTTPTYGVDSARLVESSARSTVLPMQDGKTWNIRVCRYDGGGKCSHYSNTVSTVAPYRQKEVNKVTSGVISATLSEDTLRWTFTGTAPYGFKVVWNTSGSPTYPASGEKGGAQYMPSGDSTNLRGLISDSGTYKVRVCKYTNGAEASSCVDYSSEVTYVKP